MERLIAGLGNRIFLLNNVNEDAPKAFETRWVLSYLRGPLTRVQLRQLAQQHQPAAAAAAAATAVTPRVSAAPTPTHAPASMTAVRPVLPPDISELFVPLRGMAPAGYRLIYEPALLSAAQVAFVDKKSGDRFDRNLVAVVEGIGDTVALDWSGARELAVPIEDLGSAPAAAAAYGPLPAAAGRKASYAPWKRSFADWLYANETVALFTSPNLKQTSRLGEAEQEFKLRVVQVARERRDAEIEKLRQKYETKVASLRNQVFKAEQTLQRQQELVKQQKSQTAISIGATVLGAFLGGGLGSTVGRATTAARGASRTQQKTQDVDRARESLEGLRKRLAGYEADFQADVDRINLAYDPVNQPLERVTLRPTKANITVKLVTLAWLPYWEREDGRDSRPAY